MIQAITKQFLEKNPMVSSHLIKVFEGVNSIQQPNLCQWLYAASLVFQDEGVLSFLLNQGSMNNEVFNDYLYFYNCI